MKKIQSIAAITAGAALLAANGAAAQVSKDSMGKIVPVELYICEFNEGKGQADLDAVIGQWNAWMDDQKMDDYAAWLLYPYYYGTNQDFDIIWMGASKNGKTMFEGTHKWITEGDDVAAGFNDVWSCGVHVGLSSAMYQSPPNNATPVSSILTMSDCKMNEGTRYSDVRSAEISWAEYRKENGSEAGMWHWYPTMGGGDQDYDYKIVYSYPTFKEYGEDWEMIANGGGREQSQATFADLDECNDERVYVGRNIRESQLRK